jgi:hypothetical protein
MGKNNLKIEFFSSFFMLQIIGNNTYDGNQGETNLWTDLDTDLYHWTKVLRPVQVFIMCTCVSLCWFLLHFQI